MSSIRTPIEKQDDELEMQRLEGARRRSIGWRTWLKASAIVFLIYLVLSEHITVRQAIDDHDTAHLDALGAKFEQLHAQGGERSRFVADPTHDRLDKSLSEYTKHPHLAGNLALARYTRDTWLAAGLEDVEIVQYDVLLNYPTNRSTLSLWHKDELEWRAELHEDALDKDPGSEQAVPFFHGYSKNGSASGKLVYLNYGARDDFATLARRNIDLRGKVGIARYGKCFRGLKVELAEQAGMAGVLLYDDPSEDYGLTEEAGYAAYPDGPARNPSAVQRGSVQFLSLFPGDPTTPGYASTPGCDRSNKTTSIPGIPSLPINGRQARFLLRTMNGIGILPEPGWTGGWSDVDYNIVAHETPFEARFDNVVDYDIRPIYNVIARIQGHWDDLVVLGNHRDAWVRGASDPNSGSSALDSIANTFGSLVKTGYRPLRSVVLASWDAEEYGLVGSTEWVEEHADELRDRAAVYLNVDVASSGQRFHASASPLLFSAIKAATAHVPGSNGSTTLSDEWSGKIRTLGSGSDYTAFQDFVGVSSADLGFGGPSSYTDGKGAVYHYHSQYDSYHWLTTMGDPGLLGLQAAARLWGVLAHDLIEAPAIALNATLFATEVRGYMKDALEQLPRKQNKKHAKLVKKLEKAAGELIDEAVKLDARAASATERTRHWSELGTSEQKALLAELESINGVYRGLERAFISKGGLPGRSWYKSLLFAPGRYTGYAGVVLPGVTEAKDDAQRWNELGRVLKAVKRATRALH